MGWQQGGAGEKAWLGLPSSGGDFPGKRDLGDDIFILLSPLPDWDGVHSSLSDRRERAARHPEKEGRDDLFLCVFFFP